MREGVIGSNRTFVGTEPLHSMSQKKKESIMRSFSSTMSSVSVKSTEWICEIFTHDVITYEITSLVVVLQLQLETRYSDRQT